MNQFDHRPSGHALSTKKLKMVRYLTSLVILLVSCNLAAQDVDTLLLKKQKGCKDIAENSSLLFVNYIQNNRLDSARLLVEYWESKCGMTEPVFRAKTLLSIESGLFDEEGLPDGVIGLVLNFKGRMNVIYSNRVQVFDTYPGYFGHVPPGEEFDQFTRDYALRIKNRYMAGSMPFLFCDLYSGNENEFFVKLQTAPYASSALYAAYRREVEKSIDKTEFHYSGVFGLWIPTGDLTQVGLHPEIGFQLGAKHRKMNFDLTFAIKFIDAPHEYQASRTGSNDSVEWTNHFFGGYAGLDVGRDLWVHNGHEVQVTGGMAADGFDALKEDKSSGLNSASAWSYNFNIGFSYRYYFSESFYLGFRCKYNVVDYSINHVVDFTDNTITVQFLIGHVNNSMRSAGLNALDYRWRK
jgi:hypothetical protein